MGRDPIGIAGGDLNLYGYVRDNPTGSLDPTGLLTCPLWPPAPTAPVFWVLDEWKPIQNGKIRPIVAGKPIDGTLCTYVRTRIRSRTCTRNLFECILSRPVTVIQYWYEKVDTKNTTIFGPGKCTASCINGPNKVLCPKRLPSTFLVPYVMGTQNSPPCP